MAQDHAADSPMGPRGDEVVEGSAGVLPVVEPEVAGEVLQVEGKEDPRRVELPAEDRIEQDGQQNDAVVERENAQGTPGVEVAKAIDAFARVVEDAGDEEA